MLRCTRSVRRQDGFTIIEVVAAMTILLVGVLGTYALIDRANASTAATRSREGATNLARELIEGARSVSYATLTGATIDGQVQALPGLADEDVATGWQVRRRGTVYTVTTQVCSFDDPKDGGGSHDAGSFCADSATLSSPADLMPEDYKRVTTDVTWTSDRGERRVRQTELINNPGSAGAPAVRTLVLTSPIVGDQVVSGTQLDFSLTTSSPPASLHWLLDGTSQGPVTSGSARSWSFSWQLGAVDAPDRIVDGTYLVSAEAFDAYDVAGPSKSITVRINRKAPDAVEGLDGGRTGDPTAPEDQVVDLEWLPSPERDIVGYAVFREDSAGRTRVCDMQQATSCMDVDPPNEDGIVYKVYAYDLDSAGAVREGPASAPLTVSRGNTPPLPPEPLTAQRLADGSVKLTWTRPLDPDLGDGVAFYRIYRDGSGYGDRYAVWNDSQTIVEWVDGNPASGTHSYWVTAVDGNYGESTASGPVSG